MNENKDVQKLPPFKRFCMTVGLLPASYVESMSYYESLVWLCNYLEKQVIPTINNNSEVVEELKAFVTNYFENLNVQDEIDNKLDEMVEDGTLENLINNVSKTKVYFAPVNNYSQTSSGDCSIIKTIGGKVIMIDTGVADNYVNIKNFLDEIEVEKIDYLIISHFHPDHCGNLADLMDDFDFSETVCFLPITPDSTVYSTPNSLAQTVLSLLANNEIIYPNDGTFTVDNLTLEFINSTATDLTYYTTNNMDYNNCSICTYIKDRDVTLFYSGDILAQAQARLVTLNKLQNANFYKSEHHGVNGATSSDYLKHFTPSIVMVTNDKYNTEESIAVETAGILTVKTLSYFSSLGAKVFLNSTTDSYFEFISDGYNIFNNNNKLSYKATQRDNSLSNVNNVFDIYVSSSNAGVADGTQDHPFKFISDAVRLGMTIGTTVRINLANGTYDEKVYISNIPNKLIIAGNSSDNTLVKIKQLIIFNCPCVLLNYVSFNDAINNVVYIQNSNVTIDHCVIDGDLSSQTVLNGRGVGCYNSNVNITTSEISNKTMAVGGFDNANVAVSALSGSNNNYLYGAYYNSIIKSNYTTATYNTDSIITNQGGLYFGDMLEKGIYEVGLTSNFVTTGQSLAAIPFDSNITNVNSICTLSSGTITVNKNIKSLLISGRLEISAGIQSGDTIALEVHKNGTAVQTFVSVATGSNRFAINIPSFYLAVAKTDTIVFKITDYARSGLTINKDARYSSITLVTPNI